ncbi:MAG: hypothetical protein EPN55_02055 [Gammaproteobacteria bacterium]|nr:MAG: hypothetical protein EPN55_02055 [Gammaproteobacteria bacterium]
MSFARALLIFSLILLLPLSAGAAEPKGKLIKKCQDAAGRWHYGDSAAEECAKSKITEISEKGVKKKEIAAPPTEQELREREARKDEIEKERKLAEEKQRRDELLLSTYGHEDDIAYSRDRRLVQIESAIKASEDTLQSLRAALARLEAQAAEESRGGAPVPAPTAKSIAQTKNQIATHEAAVQAKRKEQEAVRQQAVADLARYRELKQQAPATKNDKKKK